MFWLYLYLLFGALFTLGVLLGGKAWTGRMPVWEFALFAIMICILYPLVIMGTVVETTNAHFKPSLNPFRRRL